jgi:DNA repair exonuclease SbcCD ATPase subunit
VAGAAATPRAARAQTSDNVLAERRLVYNAAQADHNAAQAAFSVVERQFSAALAQLDRARRGGDQDALDAAFALAQERSIPVYDRRARVTETSERLEEARRALVDILTIRLTELVTAMSTATSPDEQAALDAVWQDLNNELEALESDADDPFRLNPVVLPEVTFDPRDTQATREQKARILERTAAMADSAVQSYDRQIEALEDRLRQERQRSDFLARAGRFGDTPPVVPTRPPGDPPVTATDSSGAPVRPSSLEERIEELRNFREQFVRYRDDLLIRAEQFRRPTRVVV